MKTCIWTALALLAAGCGSSGGGGSSGSTGGSSGSSGSSGSTGAACGTETAQGHCDGNTITFCDTASDTLVSYGCDTLVPGDVNFTCGTIDAAYGVDCGANTGTTCIFDDGQGNPIVSLCAGGPGAGCVIGLHGAICATGLPTCLAPPDGGEPPLSCQGDHLVFACSVDQPVGYDCKALGGSCASAQCVGVTAGGPCDLPDAGGIFFVCATGLSCGPTDGGGLTCQ